MIRGDGPYAGLAIGLASDLPALARFGPSRGFPGDYLRCAEAYERAGIDLAEEPLIGIGSICRRQATALTELILTTLHAHGLTRLHGFGSKSAA